MHSGNEPNMFFKSDESFHRLTTVLINYHRIADNNPEKLRLLIPSCEIWRFFVDGHRQAMSKNLVACLASDFQDYMTSSLRDLEHLPVIIQREKWNDIIKYLHLSEADLDKIQLQDLVTFNKGWFFFEKSEPGYLKSLYQAFNLVFSKQTKLTLDFIMELQKAATSDTCNTNYELWSLPPGRGKIREGNIQYPLNANTASKQGLLEFLGRDYPYLDISVNREIFFKKKKEKIVISEVPDIGNVQKNHPELYKKLVNPGSCSLLVETLMHAIHQNLPVYCRSVVNGNTAAVLREYAEGFIHTCNQALSENVLSMDKLRIIVRCIQDLEQLHMFDDANCRTLCMLLLNHLLISNGFPLCILEDPNCFDARSGNELIDRVIAGMEHTFALILEEKLFAVKTRDLIALSRQKNNFDVKESYLEELVEIEEKARAVNLRKGYWRESARL